MSTFKDIMYMNLPMRVFRDGRIIVKERLNSRGYWTKERQLVPRRTKAGYIYDMIHANGQQRIAYFHRIIAEAFIPNPTGLPQVNHINEDKSDNRIENLEWCDGAYNISYSYQRHHSNGKARKACAAFKDGALIKIFSSAAEASRWINMNRGLNGKAGRGNISSACRGELKSAYGYTWKFID
jgi:hypothetical protein